MPRYRHPDDDTVFACPECDRSPIYKRVQDNTVYDRDKEFVCYDCQVGFDEPVERKAKTNGSHDSIEQLPDHIQDMVEAERAD